MAETDFFVDLDINQNELKQPVIHKLAAAPPAPVEGQVYYHTGDKIWYGWTGTDWCRLSSELDAYVLGEQVGYLYTEDMKRIAY